MQVYEKKLHLSTLLERAAEELGLDEDVLVAEYGPDVPVPVEAGFRTRRATSDEIARAPTDESIAGRRPISTSESRTSARSSRRASRPPSASSRSSAGSTRSRSRSSPRSSSGTSSSPSSSPTSPTTRKDLLTIIDEIDEKMQDIFVAAFEDTKAAFNQVFPVLFPGGTGSIHLTDPDEPAHHRHRGDGEARPARRSSGSRCSPAASGRSPRSPC